MINVCFDEYIMLEKYLKILQYILFGHHYKYSTQGDAYHLDQDDPHASFAAIGSLKLS